MSVVQDNRSGSTLDAIAAEELAENEEFAAKVEADAEAKAEAAFAELADGWKQAVVTAGDIITSVLPEAKPVWTEERMTNLGAALARADDAYGWGGAGTLFKHPIVGVAVASFPLAVGTAQVVRAKTEAAKVARLRGTQGAQHAAPVVGDTAPVEQTHVVPVPAAVKPTPLNPGGAPAFGS